MKKYSNFIKESNENIKNNLTREQFVKLLANLKDENGDYFIIYKFKMFNVINKLLKSHSTPKNLNPDYQYPLSLLYETGKYEDIIKKGNLYYTEKLSSVSCVYDENGKWHPVNKLNTNAYDQAELLYDLFKKINLYEYMPVYNEIELKKWLLDFIKINKEEGLYNFIVNNVNFKEYTKWNRIFSKKGEEIEKMAIKILINNGCDILYNGGDGDFIDMVYGVDIIVKKNNKIYTVQVKSKEDGARNALNKAIKFEKSMYNKIDWFCYPNSGSSINIITKKNQIGKTIS